MKYALIGYGRMGRAVEAAAGVRGHVRAAVVDRAETGSGIVRTLDEVRWRGVAVAFEFTAPEAAREHVVGLLERGVSVVCGTTGWDASDVSVRRAARASRAAAVIAPNFSVGMSLFYAAVAEVARRYLAAGSYDPWVAEWHHRGKADAPSGTALSLAGLVAGSSHPRTRVHVGLAKEAIGAAEVHVAAVRAGHEPGRHVVGFDGPHDAVTLEHAARGRGGFAAGAVLAAEWLKGRRGLHGFDEVVEDLVRRARKHGGTR